MRTSFHHQPEAQHPKSSAIHKLPADYPIFAPESAQITDIGGRLKSANCRHAVQQSMSVAGSHAPYRERTFGLLALRRTPISPALLASHHQTVGKAEAPYSGNGVGRPKRSQRAARTLSSVNCGTT